MGVVNRPISSDDKFETNGSSNMPSAGCRWIYWLNLLDESWWNERGHVHLWRHELGVALPSKTSFDEQEIGVADRLTLEFIGTVLRFPSGGVYIERGLDSLYPEPIQAVCGLGVIIH